MWKKNKICINVIRYRSKRFAKCQFNGSNVKSADEIIIRVAQL